MPVEDVGLLARLFGWLFIDLLVEVVLERTGRAVLKGRRNPNPSDLSCRLAGFAIWLVLCVVGVSAWQYMNP